MQAINTKDGVVIGSWLFVRGVAIYKGPRYLSTHQALSDAANRRRGYDPEADYHDAKLTPEQHAVVHDILHGLGR